MIRPSYMRFLSTYSKVEIKQIHRSIEIATRLPTDTAAADHVIVPPVINLQSHKPVVPDGCSNVGSMTNCIATNTATTISATAKLSKSMFIGGLMVLVKRITRITRVLPTRPIKTMIKNATLRQMYSTDFILYSEKGKRIHFDCCHSFAVL